jgi:hypothetical protein
VVPLTEQSYEDRATTRSRDGDRSVFAPDVERSEERKSEWGEPVVARLRAGGPCGRGRTIGAGAGHRHLAGSDGVTGPGWRPDRCPVTRVDADDEPERAVSVSGTPLVVSAGVVIDRF